VLAALLAPFMAPAIGLGLAAVTGSVQFFLQSLASLLAGSVIIFGTGALSGWLTKWIPAHGIQQTVYHSTLTIFDTILLAIGVILTVILFTRPRNQQPLVTSVAIAYEIYLPVGVAGFGLTSANPDLLQGGCKVFLLNLGLTLFLTMMTLIMKGLKFQNTFSYLILSLLILAGILGGMWLGGVFKPGFESTPAPIPSDLPSPTAEHPTQPSGTWTPPAPTPQNTEPLIFSAPTDTLIPTGTATQTLTPLPTLVQAFIHASDSTGAYVRKEPNFSAPILPAC